MATKDIDARTSMFGRLAVESGLVTHEDIVACIEEQGRQRAEGSRPVKLGEILIERGILTQSEVDTILRMQSNPGGLIGRQLVEKGLVTREQLKKALDEQAEYLRAGRTPPKLGDMVVELGYAKRSDLELMFKRKEAGGDLFGEFLVANKLVKQDDINKCLIIQKDEAGKGEAPKKLGELLVSCGVLRKDQVEIYSRRHLQAKRIVVPPTAGEPIRRSASSRKRRGDFEILQTLGQHADGVTYRAIHAPSGAVVVTHFFAEAGSPEEEEAAAARRVNLSRIHGRGVQATLSVDEVGGLPMLAAEYIDGVSLSKTVADKGKIEWTWAAEILYDVTAGLLAAERLGLYHDDIRPGTILVTDAGHAKLGMWGYTRDPVANRDWLTQRHRPLPYYFAPERIDGKPSAHADMFSLGLTLIHALTGTPSLTANSAAESVAKYSVNNAMNEIAIDMSLPLGLISILSRMVEAKPENRFAGHAELLEAVASMMMDEGLDPEEHRPEHLAGRALTKEEADETLSRFLQTDMTGREERKVPLHKLAKYYVGPVVAMVVVMLIVTVIYRQTQSSRGMMVRANYLDAQGDKAGALSLYRLGSMIYPKEEATQQRYYDLAMEMKDHGEAEIALERLMALHPARKNEYLEKQADLQVWQKRYLSAVDLYREVQMSKPQDTALKEKIASALLWGRNYADAEDEYKELVATLPGNNNLLLNLASAAAGNNDYATAQGAFDRLFRDDILPEASLMQYAWLLHDEGHDAELTDLAKTVLARKETADYSRQNMVHLYYWAGDYKNAVKALDSLAGMAQNDKELLLTRINLDDKLGDVDSAIRDYKRLAELDPNDSAPLMTVGRLYQGKQDFKNADIYFRQALARDENSHEIRRTIAENLGYMEDKTEAIRWYREVLAKTPSDTEAMNGLIENLLWTEKYDEAAQYVEKLYKADPKNVTNRLNLALVYSRLGRGKEALNLVDGLLAEGVLSEADRVRLATNAMISNSNELLLRLVGNLGGDERQMSELRLMLARRLRAEGRHGTALPLYAAVLAATPDPDPKLLVEMAETANWAGRHDVATAWLELARDLVAAKDAGKLAQFKQGPGGQRFLLTQSEWDSILGPLQKQPEVYGSLSGFKQRFGRADVVPVAAPIPAAGKAAANIPASAPVSSTKVGERINRGNANPDLEKLGRDLLTGTRESPVSEGITTTVDKSADKAVDTKDKVGAALSSVTADSGKYADTVGKAAQTLDKAAGTVGSDAGTLQSLGREALGKETGSVSGSMNSAVDKAAKAMDAAGKLSDGGARPAVSQAVRDEAVKAVDQAAGDAANKAMDKAVDKYF